MDTPSSRRSPQGLQRYVQSRTTQRGCPRRGIQLRPTTRIHPKQLLQSSIYRTGEQTVVEMRYVGLYACIHLSQIQSAYACKIYSNVSAFYTKIHTCIHTQTHTHIPRFLCRRAQQANAGQYLGAKRPLQSQTYPCRLALVWRRASLRMLKSAP